ncbi:MAG: iron uptake transporter deferrochelatase/peroxidase subunit [Candidatus Nanopelagicales bacterium]
MQVDRRGFLGGVIGGAALGATTATVVTSGPASATPGATDAIALEGAHQAGIVTPAQDRLNFVAFDVTTTDRADLRALLVEWTAAARQLTAGSPLGETGAVDGNVHGPPEDTGEALDLPAAGLTVTIGFGRSLFGQRFGLASRRPAALVDIPAFPLDELDPGATGGDICLQICSNDEQVAFHAARQFTRIGAGVVNPRYVQQGHVRTSGVQPKSTTPRNLMGFKDGTSNVKADDVDAIWAGGSDWMSGGSYLVTRRIRMMIEPWDRTSLIEQEEVIGRTKGVGAPLGAATEHASPDFGAQANGKPVIPADAHVRLAHPDQHGGARLLRRGYNYTDGIDRTGRIDAGLFFMAYQADPRRAFIPIQTTLAVKDSLNEYIKHVGSGIWACPPGVRQGQSWGHALFG